MKRLFLPLILIASAPLMAMYSKSDLTYKDDTICNAEGDTLLICAVKQGNIEAVRALLPLDSTQVDAQNKAGVSALHIAAFKGNEKICKLLMSVGASPNNPRANFGVLPIDLARMNEQKAILQLFAQYKLVPLCLSKTEKEAQLAAVENAQEEKKEKEFYGSPF